MKVLELISGNWPSTRLFSALWTAFALAGAAASPAQAASGTWAAGYLKCLGALNDVTSHPYRVQNFGGSYYFKASSQDGAQLGIYLLPQQYFVDLTRFTPGDERIELNAPGKAPEYIKVNLKRVEGVSVFTVEREFQKDPTQTYRKLSVAPQVSDHMHRQGQKFLKSSLDSAVASFEDFASKSAEAQSGAGNIALEGPDAEASLLPSSSGVLAQTLEKCKNVLSASDPLDQELRSKFHVAHERVKAKMDRLKESGVVTGTSAGSSAE